MKHLIYILVITSFGIRPVQTLGQMTLLDAKEYAIKNHYNIANSILEYDKAIHQKKEYLAAGMPEANITGAFNQFVNLPVQVLPVSFFNPAAPEEEIIAFKDYNPKSYPRYPQPCESILSSRFYIIDVSFNNDYAASRNIVFPNKSLRG